MLVSVVIPVYESMVVAELADRIAAAFAGLPEHRYEVVLVDDGSPSEAVWVQLAGLAASRPNITALQLTRNFGQQAATLCGLKVAAGDWVVTMDDDLQHDPADIPRLLSAPQADIVVAQFPRKHHGLGKRLASRIKGHFDRIVLGKPPGIQLSSFRALSRTVVDGMLATRSPHPFLPALMFHVSRRVVGVTVEHRPRRVGRSTYTLRKQLQLFSNLLINNSSLLLRLVGNIGVIFAFAAFALAAYVAYRRIVHQVLVPGWASLLASNLLIGGLLLFSVGIVGEYLIRIIETSEARPLYFVRRSVSGSADPR